VVSERTGQAIADMATDVLVRLNLPMAGLRGQGYDGAANMAGKYSGAQAILRRQQPLALYVHCGAHCSNLITQAACSASPLIQDSLFWVHQLGVLFGQSGKFKAMFADIATTDNQPEPMINFKLLCSTRWTVWDTAIKAVLTQYDRVLCSLDKMAGSTSKSAASASGLADHFRKGKIILGLTLASAVVGELECLNKSLQRRTQTVSGMLAVVDCVRSSFQEKRNDQHYVILFEKANAAVVESAQIQPTEVPNARLFPGEAVDYYRVEFFKVLDTVDAQFAERFDQEGFKDLQKLENMFLTGQVDDMVDQYPELKRGALAVELPFFKSKYDFSCSKEAAEILRELPVEVRGLFEQVEALVRLLLVVPASSFEAERSFSALKRLKTWLRATMSQERLNSVVVCHVHREEVDELDRPNLCQQFVAGSSQTHLGSIA